jgi:hypothetical protein
LLTPHGFQTVLLVFMPHGSAVFEIFPYKYWKDGYRPLANEYGLFHGWSQNHRATSPSRNLALSFISQPACMQWARCREFARRDDVNMDEATVKAIALLARHASGDTTETGAAAESAMSPSVVERGGYEATIVQSARDAEPWYHARRRVLRAAGPAPTEAQANHTVEPAAHELLRRKRTRKKRAFFLTS